MKKRIMSILLSMSIIIGLMPVTALAYVQVVEIGGQIISGGNPYLVNNMATATGTLGTNGCTAWFNIANSTLYLNGLDINKSDTNLRVIGDINLALSGNNSIICANNAGISLQGSLNILGDGNLTVQSNSSLGSGINASSTITFNGTGKIKTTGYYGISSRGCVTINSGIIESYSTGFAGIETKKLIISGGTVAASGSTAHHPRPTAFYPLPDLSGYTSEKIVVVSKTHYDGSDTSVWDNTSDLQDYWYVKIVPTGNYVTPFMGSFDRYAPSPNYKDVAISVVSAYGDYKLSAIKNGSYTLVSGTDYTLSGGVVTFKKEYLAKLAMGTNALTVDMSGGIDPTVTITVTDSAPINASVSQTSASYDQYAYSANWADINITLAAGSYTLSNIKNDSYTLVKGIDYAVLGNIITFKQTYLDTLAVGPHTLTFDMSGGTDPTVDITVIDSTPINASVSPTTASFDKYVSSANYANVDITLTVGKNTLSNIKNGSSTLVSGTDYTILGNIVTFPKEYLANLATDTYTLTFDMSGGTDPTVDITVTDSTPINASVSPTTASFDKYASSANYANVDITLTAGSYTLSAIKNGSSTLVSGQDYTVSGNKITFNKEYFAKLATDTYTLTFDMSGGTDPTETITVTDSTPISDSVSPTTASFDKYAASPNYTNIDFTLTTAGSYILSDIKNGSSTLASGTDYTVSGSIVTFQKEYLANLAMGIYTLTFDMSGGTDPTVTINVTDSTPINASVSPTTASFDKYAAGANYTNVDITLTTAGSYILSDIKNGSSTLVSGTDYTVSGSSITFRKEYLANLATGTHTLTFDMSGGTDPTVTITVTDSTPASNGSTSGSSGHSSYVPAVITEIDSNSTLTINDLNRLVSNQKTLTVNGEKSKMVFDNTALEEIYSQANMNLTFVIEEAENKLTDAQKKVVGEGRVYDLTISSGGKTISNFGTGTVTVTIPYELKAGERGKDISVWYLADNGSLTKIPCTYNVLKKEVNFTVTHFSKYIVGSVLSIENPFNDVSEDDWFYNSVMDIYFSGIMKGTTEERFEPDTAMTRGMIVTALWNIEEAPKDYSNSFIDVANNMYNTDAIAWAAAKGIVAGYGKGKFGPNDNLTREQFVTIIYNYAVYKGYNMKTTDTLTGFRDTESISSWAQPAIKWSVTLKLLNGKNNGIIDPKGNATRAEAAAIVMRFLKAFVK